MNTKKLGNSQIEVSEMCLGTMYFGTKIEKKVSFRLLDKFLDLGGNFIDTANNYAWWMGSGNESELLLGEWMRTRKNRTSVILASKVGSKPIVGKKTYVREGLKKATIINSVNDSLKRLKTDYLDLCYIHADLKNYPIYERLDALDDLFQSGKIKLKGLSNISTQRLMMTNNKNEEMQYSDLSAIQQKFTYLDPIEDKTSTLISLDPEMLDIANKKDFSVLTYSNLLSGAYSRNWEDIPDEYNTISNKKKFERMKKNALNENLTVSQFVLKWILNQSDKIIPIIAVSSEKQLMENLKVLDV